MNDYILDLKDANKLHSYDKKKFNKKVYYVQGYKIISFDYFLCDYNDFENPIPDNPNIKAYDMRGVTFVFNKDGTLYKRFFMIPKFFNINQVPDTQYDVIKDKSILKVTEKEDGSLIAFMMLPNEEIFAKTIRSPETEQAITSNKIINSRQKHYIKTVIKAGYTPLFEFVSLKNRIVLKYDMKPELRLIGLRLNTIPLAPLSFAPITYNKPFKCVKNIQGSSLDDLIEMAKTKENYEGWVVQFDDGQIVKIKTAWYFDKHYIRAESVFREDYIMRVYITNKIDDLKSNLSVKDDKDALEFIDEITSVVDNFIEWIDNYTDKYLVIYHNRYKRDWDKFATDNGNNEYFFLIQAKIYDIEVFNNKVKKYILSKTIKRERSRKFIRKWKLMPINKILKNIQCQKQF